MEFNLKPQIQTNMKCIHETIDKFDNKFNYHSTCTGYIYNEEMDVLTCGFDHPILRMSSPIFKSDQFLITNTNFCSTDTKIVFMLTDCGFDISVSTSSETPRLIDELYSHICHLYYWTDEWINFYGAYEHVSLTVISDYSTMDDISLPISCNLLIDTDGISEHIFDDNKVSFSDSNYIIYSSYTKSGEKHFGIYVMLNYDYIKIDSLRKKLTRLMNGLY